MVGNTKVSMILIRGRGTSTLREFSKGGALRASRWHLPLRPWGDILSESPRPSKRLKSKGRQAPRGFAPASLPAAAANTVTARSVRSGQDRMYTRGGKKKNRFCRCRCVPTWIGARKNRRNEFREQEISHASTNRLSNIFR